jgi:predicted dehydrogenase
MKVCIIGVRGHCSYVFDGWDDLDDIGIVGISAGDCDDDLAPLEALCSQAGQSPQAFADWRAMLDTCRPDALCIAGPFEANAATCIEAFARNIHVFCEKPVALTMDDLAAVQEAYDACDVHFIPMMGMRYDPAFYTAWQAVQAGAVGDIRLLNARKSYKLGQRADFYKDRTTYGGTIPWVGSHGVDWIRWFAGREFVSVYASHSRLANRGHGSLETAALCHFTLADEIAASLSIDYYRPTGAASHGDDRIRVVGTDGVIEVAGGAVMLIDAGGEQELPGDCDRTIFGDFVAGIRTGQPALLTADDAFVVTDACLRARLSADEERVVFFGEAT